MINDRLSELSSVGQVVRVSIPARVAFDLQSMQRITAQVLGKLGCEACHSGFDIRFDLARDFVVDENLRVATAGQPG